jgi:hypothetical protein
VPSRSCDQDSEALVVVVATEIDPVPSVWRPGSAPAAVVRGIDKRSAEEGEATEAMMEAVVPESKVTIAETVVTKTEM